MVKALIVVTNHEALGDTGKKTGWYLPEVAHPYHVFKEAGYDVTFVSPKGGKAPLDPTSNEAFKEDPVCKPFLKNSLHLLANTKTPTDVTASDYDVILYAGGHGPMFDVATDPDLATLGAGVYENNGVVSAVCHGTCGLLPIRLTNGKALLEGQTVTSFTNEEEEAIKLMEAMPFPLETRLTEAGAKFVGADNWTSNVQVSGRIVTGQNPASATAMAEAIVKVVRGLLK